MKNKLAKSMSMIIAIAMLISMVPAVVSAAENITEPLAVVNSDGSITVTATVAASTIDEYTLLAVRDASVYDDTTDLPATDEALEAQIEYIDQPALKDGAVSATFKLRERDGSSYGNIINVLLGGEDTDVAYTSVKIRNASPKDLAVTDADLWSGEDVVITYTANAAWEATTRTVEVDGTAINSENVVFEAGSITIKNLAIGEYDVIEIFEADDNWETVTLGVEGTKLFELKSRVEAAKAEAYTDITTENTDVVTDDSYEYDTYVVTVPASKTAASGATITYAVEYDTENTKIAVDGNVYTITRVVDAESSITVKATISAEGETDYVDETGRTYTAAILGADGPSVTDLGTIEFANYDGTVFENVYGKTGARVVEIAKGDIDVTAYNVVVKDLDGTDDVTLFYSPEREKYVGIVFGFTDVDTVSTKIEFAEKEASDESKYIYYGFVRDPHKLTLTAFGANDGMKILQVANRIETEPTDAMLISGDVKQNGKLDSNDRMHILQVINNLDDALDITEK